MAYGKKRGKRSPKDAGAKAIREAKAKAGGSGTMTKSEKSYKKAVKADIKSLKGQKDPEAREMKKGLKSQLKSGY